MVENSNFKFLGYGISKVNLEIKDGFRPQQLDKKIDVENIFNKENNRFVEVVLDIKLTSKDKTFLFSLRIQGVFEANKDMSDELFQKMSSQNAPAILFPYARAIISTFTAQSGIPTIILPTVSFTAKPKKQARKKASK